MDGGDRQIVDSEQILDSLVKTSQTHFKAPVKPTWEQKAIKSNCQ